MSAVRLASPAYRYGGKASLFLISSSAGQREIEADAPKLQAVLGGIISEWYSETFLTSSVDHMRQTPALNKLVKFGMSAVPAIINEISRKPSYLFLALEPITGVNPIEDCDRGNVEAMCRAWIVWHQNKKSWFF